MYSETVFEKGLKVSLVYGTAGSNGNFFYLIERVALVSRYLALVSY